MSRWYANPNLASFTPPRTWYVLVAEKKLEKLLGCWQEKWAIVVRRRAALLPASCVLLGFVHCCFEWHALQGGAAV